MTPAKKAVATPDKIAELRSLARQALAARYRPMMEEYLAEQHPEVAAEGIIGNTLDMLAEILPHYRYRQEETQAFQLYLRKVLQKRADDARPAWKRKDKRAGRSAAGKRRANGGASGSAAGTVGDMQVSEEELAAAREWFAMRDAVALMTMQEMEGATSNKMHWEVFCRICLTHEKPAAVAKALDISLANAYQVKKRLLDRFRGIGRALFDQVGM